MNFGELINLTYNYIDETDEDEQIEVIVKGAINEAYSILSSRDARLNRAYIPIINGIATLPEDNIGIVKCTPELDDSDLIIDNNIVTSKTGTLELLYKYVRETLVDYNEEPDIHILLQYAMVNYACYKYFLYRKKTEVAQSFNTQYENYIYKFEKESKDNSNAKIDTIKFVNMME